MISIAQGPRPMTIEEYLEMEERSHEKHHFVKDQIITVPGGTLKHNIIATNIIYAIQQQIRQNALDFLVSNSDTKIWIPAI